MPIWLIVVLAVWLALAVACYVMLRRAARHAPYRDDD